MLGFHPGAVDGQVACRVACAFLAFVAGVVLFVDHDQPQPRCAAQHRHAGAQNDARLPQVRGQPVAQALGRCHATVHGGHLGRTEAGSETLQQHGREVDLGHHDQHLRGRVSRQQALGGLQVDFCFATAGGTEQQHGLVVRSRAGQRVECQLLLRAGVQCRRNR